MLKNTRKAPIYYPKVDLNIEEKTLKDNPMITININNVEYLNSYQLMKLNIELPTLETCQKFSNLVWYPFAIAADICNLPVNTFNRSRQRNQIEATKLPWKNYTSRYINQYDLGKLKAPIQLMQNNQLFSYSKMAKVLNTNVNLLREIINSHKIEPAYIKRIAGEQKYFDKKQVQKIKSIIGARRKHNRKTFQFESNTTISFNANVDYRLTDLRKALNISNNRSNVIYQWMKHDRIPYSVDPQYQIYFTPMQFETICQQYKKHPQIPHIALQEAAKQVNKSNAEVLRIAHSLKLKSFKILGIKGAYLTMDDFEKIKIRISHPKKRGRKHK